MTEPAPAAAPSAPAQAPAAPPAPEAPVAPAPGQAPAEKAGGTPAAAPSDFSLEAPKDSLLDSSRLESLTSFAKEKGLSKEVAQALVEQEATLLANYRSGMEAQLKAEDSKWVESLKTDAVFGGEKFAENSEIAKRAILHFGGEAFANLVLKTGLGNQPDFVKAWWKVGLSMQDGSTVRGGTPPPSGQGRAVDKMFPSTAKKT